MATVNITYAHWLALLLHCLVIVLVIEGMGDIELFFYCWVISRLSYNFLLPMSLLFSCYSKHVVHYPIKEGWQILSQKWLFKQEAGWSFHPRNLWSGDHYWAHLPLYHLITCSTCTNNIKVKALCTVVLKLKVHLYSTHANATFLPNWLSAFLVLLRKDDGEHQKKDSDFAFIDCERTLRKRNSYLLHVLFICRNSTYREHSEKFFTAPIIFNQPFLFVKQIAFPSH